MGDTSAYRIVSKIGDFHEYHIVSYRWHFRPYCSALLKCGSLLYLFLTSKLFELETSVSARIVEISKGYKYLIKFDMTIMVRFERFSSL